MRKIYTPAGTTFHFDTKSYYSKRPVTIICDQERGEDTFILNNKSLVYDGVWIAQHDSEAILRAPAHDLELILDKSCSPMSMSELREYAAMLID